MSTSLKPAEAVDLPIINTPGSTSRSSSPNSIAATRGSTPAISPRPTPATTPALSDTFERPGYSAASSSTQTSTASSMLKDALQSGKSSTPASSVPTASSKRPPNLSDIAARLNVADGKEVTQNSDKEGSHLDINAPLRGRLGLAGRLNSSSSETGASSDEGSAEGPRPLAHGAPPSKITDMQHDAAGVGAGGVPGSSGRTSPSKGKAMPSLEEIRARINKKGHPTSSAGVGAAVAADSSSSPSAARPIAAAAPTKSPVVPPQTLSVSPQNKPVRADGHSAASAALAMPPPLSTKPLSSGPARAAPSHRPQDPAGKKLHPLQHEWTLFFDSKTGNPVSASSTPSGTPNLEHYAPWLSTPPPGQGPTPALPPTPSTPATPLKGNSSSQSWEAALKKVGEYHAVETFMSVFATIRRPSSLDKHSNYHLFKDGIKPMWEDPANAKGGKWVLTFQRNLTNPALLDRSWVWLVLALIGEELDLDDEITGAVVSTRPKVDRIALWVRGKDDVAQVNRIGRKLVDLLEVEREPGVSLEFTANSSGAYQRPNASGANNEAGAATYWGFHNAGPPGGGHHQHHAPAPSGAPGGRTLAPGHGPVGHLSQASRTHSSGSGVVGGGVGLGLGQPIGRTGSPALGVGNLGGGIRGAGGGRR